jgi:hypothetical protein
MLLVHNHNAIETVISAKGFKIYVIQAIFSSELSGKIWRMKNLFYSSIKIKQIVDAVEATDASKYNRKNIL